MTNISNIYDFSKDEMENYIENEIDFEKINELCEHITDAIKEILTSCGLYFRIFSRVKSVKSIANKLNRGKYGTEANPKKIQDLLGLRVVLYYYDDLRICRDIMESTFQIVDTWSRNSFNSDEFRATKINGVFRFPEEYFNFYKRELWNLPIDTTFEIQFRTVFFEGWHEIEHDMRYKSLLSDDQFWKGSEELSRILNCILANLELSDWSLVQLFEQLSYNHYKNGNWELMLKSKFRIKIKDDEHLHPEILKIFDSDKEIAKQFFKCTRQRLIRELLKLDHPHVNYNTIVKLLNNGIVHNPDIKQICDTIDTLSEEPAFQKVSLARLESNILFHLELPLLHKETRQLQSEFNTAASILYKWARFRMNPVFEDIPADLSPYKNKLPGYLLKIKYDPDELTFSMKLNYIDTKLVGTLWHVHSSIALLDDGKLHFYHMTSRDMPHGATERSTFNKPSFLSDLSSKVGLCDIYRLGSQVHFISSPEDYTLFSELINSNQRQLPVVLITQKYITADSESDNTFREGYDMNTFNVNGTRLAKVIGHYSHVYMLDQSMVEAFANDNNISLSNAYGCICVFWSKINKRSPSFFTQQMICDTEFDFNRFAFHDKNINEKAFRHKLVQIIKDDNISH